MKKQEVKECKHEFVHTSASNWHCVIIKVYCKKCGIDEEDLPRNKLKRLFGNR